MDQLHFFRSVSSWGKVIFSILKVFSLIGAIGVLIGVLALSFMPGDFVRVESETHLDVKVNLARVLGDEWQKQMKEAGIEPGDVVEGASVDEDGVTVSETVPVITVENRTLSLAIIPTLVSLILSYFLFRILSRIFGAFKTASEPLRLDLKADLRRVGGLFIALGVLPGVCTGLITLLTDTGDLFQANWNLSFVFAGFLIWAFSDLLVHAAAYLPAEPVTADAANAPAGDSGDNPNAF